jgi:hypothetical protein
VREWGAEAARARPEVIRIEYFGIVAGYARIFQTLPRTPEGPCVG